MKCILPTVNSAWKRVFCATTGVGLVGLGAFGAKEGITRSQAYYDEKRWREMQEQIKNDARNIGYDREYYMNCSRSSPYTELCIATGLTMIMGVASVGCGIVLVASGKQYVQKVRQMNQCCHIIRASALQTFITSFYAFGLGGSGYLGYTISKDIPKHFDNARKEWNKQ